METAWDALIAGGFENIGIRPIWNMDPVTGLRSYTYGAFVGTPYGQVIVEKATAAEAVTIVSSAILSFDDQSETYEQDMANLVRRSENDERKREAQRELDYATFNADND